MCLLYNVIHIITKTCFHSKGSKGPSCGLEKPLSCFYKDSKQTDGHCNQCKSCWKIRHKKYLSTKAGRAAQIRNRLTSINTYEKHTHNKNAQLRYRQSAHGKRVRLTEYLKRIHRITLQDYTNKFEAQKGCCSICGTHQSDLKRSLAVDHNHSTGVIRDLLCSKCNLGLGYFKDSTELLVKVIQYLQRHT
jgi:Recombination endonuclease VII